MFYTKREVLAGLGMRLRETRIKLGFKSMKAMSLALGMPQSTYSQYELGRRDMGIATFCFICDKLHLCPHKLLGYPCKISEEKI